MPYYRKIHPGEGVAVNGELLPVPRKLSLLVYFDPDKDLILTGDASP